MYFTGQCWTIDDDKNPNNATFYKSTDTANPDRDRPADVKWNGASSSSAESQPLQWQRCCALAAERACG